MPRELIEDFRLAADPVAFVGYVGSRLKREVITPDPWQRRFLRSTAKQKIVCTSRQVGKSTMVAGLALWRALFFPETLVLIVAPTERQSKIAFAKVSRLFKAWGGTVDTLSARRLGFEFANGSQIEALPGNPNTIQGFSPNLVIIDEGAFIDDELYYIMRPALAATNGDLVMVSKPNAKLGVFYDEWIHRHVRGWDWWEVKATDSPRITDEFLEQERLHMPESRFLREYFCEFLEAEDAAFRESDLQKMASDDVQPLTY